MQFQNINSLLYIKCLNNINIDKNYIFILVDFLEIFLTLQYL